MPAELAADLAIRLRSLAAQGVAEPLPFLVTLAPGAAALPFKVETAVEAIRMAAGRMSAAQALALAQRGDIERIELDGQMQALDALLKP